MRSLKRYRKYSDLSQYWVEVDNGTEGQKILEERSWWNSLEKVSDPFFPLSYKVGKPFDKDLSYKDARLLFHSLVRMELGLVEECDSEVETLHYIKDWKYQDQDLYFEIGVREYGDSLSICLSSGRAGSFCVTSERFSLNPQDINDTFNKIFTGLKELSLLARRFIAFEGDEE